MIGSDPMLTTNNLKHCLNVARYMYRHADDIIKNPTEEDRRNLWMLGLLHDIGREFSIEDGKYHGEVSEDLARSFCERYENFKGTLADHGLKAGSHDALSLLNNADLRIDSKGNRVTVEERLENIKRNHGGKETVAYKTAKKLAESLR